MRLYDERYWRLLLHMNGSKSEIDDPRFFFAENGKTDPKAELYATIEALYDTTYLDDNATQCRFPARTMWLRDTLQLKNLPRVTCKAYSELVKKVDPQSVTLVFADAHINSPASMFGHTFLRIDSAFHSKLLAHAINYSANADPKKENGILFAFKGLFGGYTGIYSLLPYYEKLKEYKNTEQRDIWEYDLNLTPQEIARMVAHIWELHDSYSWYFFFDENCSYHMLWLLEVARPSVRLREHFFYQVIPPETIFAVDEEGLIESMRYRASKRSLLLAYEQALTLRERNNVIALAKGNAKADDFMKIPMSDAKRRLMLEAAAELCEYYYIEQDIDKERYLTTFHALLSERSRLGRAKTVTPTPPENPIYAHRSARLEYALGRVEDKVVNYFGIRAAYQDMSDSDVGMLRGVEIEFLDIAVRAYDATVELEHLDIISLASYAMRSSFFSPFSWNMQVGWDRDSLSEELLFKLRLGIGESWGGARWQGYVLLEPLLYYDDSDTTLSIAPMFGGALYLTRDIKLNGEYRYRYYSDGTKQQLMHASLLFGIEQNLAFKLKYEHIERFLEDQNRFKAVIDYYF